MSFFSTSRRCSPKRSANLFFCFAYVDDIYQDACKVVSDLTRFPHRSLLHYAYSFVLKDNGWPLGATGCVLIVSQSLPPPHDTLRAIPGEVKKRNEFEAWHGA